MNENLKLTWIGILGLMIVLGLTTLNLYILEKIFKEVN